MNSNEALALFKAEYTRLYESLYKTHRNEKELLEQCTLLKVKLHCNMKKIKYSFSLFLLLSSPLFLYLFLSLYFRNLSYNIENAFSE